MDKEKCYEIIDRCKSEINEVAKECDGKDGNSVFLALELMRDMDRLKKCISIKKQVNNLQSKGGYDCD